MRLFLLLTLFINAVNGLNIVVYLSLVGKSHIDFVASLIDILVEKGHKVDYVVARLNSGVKWEGTSRARNVTSFGFPGKESPWMQMDHLKDPFQENTHFDMIKFYGIQNELCKIGIESGEPLQFLKAGKYDAAIVSDYDYCGAILAKAAGIPSVMSYTATNIMHSQALHIGLASPVSCVTSNFDRYDGSLSFWAKILRLIDTGIYTLHYRPYAINQQTALARSVYGADFSSVDELITNYDLVFINSNEIIETPRSLSHKVRFIGGIGLKYPKPLTHEFKRYLDFSKGAVILSFGTQVPSEKVPPRVKLALAHAFKEFSNYTFIWKYEQQPGDEAYFANLKNLHMVKWLPQNDILHHKKVIAFITHAGLNSFLEASYAGVPVVSIPLFADQGHNARSMTRLGMGVQLNKVIFTGDDLTEALRKVIYDKSYTENTHRISQMMKTKPDRARQGFAEWVEFAAKNPGLHEVFNLPEAGMSVFTYYCIDVVGFVILAIIAAGIIAKKLFVSANRVLSHSAAKVKVN